MKTPILSLLVLSCLLPHARAEEATPAPTTQERLEQMRDEIFENENEILTMDRERDALYDAVKSVNHNSPSYQKIGPRILGRIDEISTTVTDLRAQVTSLENAFAKIRREAERSGEKLPYISIYNSPTHFWGSRQQPYDDSSEVVKEAYNEHEQIVKGARELSKVFWAKKGLLRADADLKAMLDDSKDALLDAASSDIQEERFAIKAKLEGLDKQMGDLLANSAEVRAKYEASLKEIESTSYDCVAKNSKSDEMRHFTVNATGTYEIDGFVKNEALFQGTGDQLDFRRFVFERDANSEDFEIYIGETGTGVVGVRGSTRRWSWGTAAKVEYTYASVLTFTCEMHPAGAPPLATPPSEDPFRPNPFPGYVPAPLTGPTPPQAQ